MDCCLLSSEEVGRLVHYGITPKHDEHTHLSTDTAIALLKDETLELITDRNGRHYVTRAKMHFLRVLPSDGIPVVQRVESNQLLELKPIR
jgi:hypothetical protein